MDLSLVRSAGFLILGLLANFAHADSICTGTSDVYESESSKCTNLIDDEDNGDRGTVQFFRSSPDELTVKLFSARMNQSTSYTYNLDGQWHKSSDTNTSHIATCNNDRLLIQTKGVYPGTGSVIYEEYEKTSSGLTRTAWKDDNKQKPFLKCLYNKK